MFPFTALLWPFLGGTKKNYKTLKKFKYRTSGPNIRHGRTIFRVAVLATRQRISMLRCISCYGVSDIAVYQMLRCIRCCSVSDVAVYQMLRCISCYGVSDIAVYQILRCIRCCGVSDVAVYQMLRCIRCYGVSDVLALSDVTACRTSIKIYTNSIKSITV